MASLISWVLLAAVVSAVRSAPQPSSFLGNTLEQAPVGWKLLETLDRQESKLTVHFGVRRSAATTERLHHKFLTVSDPDHPDYGNHWSRSELQAAVASAPEDVAAVVDWVRSSTADFQDDVVVSVNSCNDMVTVNAQVAALEQLLSVIIHSFQSTVVPSMRIARTLSAAKVPSSVASKVDAVFGLHSFPVVSNKTANNAAALALGSKVDPSVIRTLYNVTEDFSGKTKASQALAEFQGQGYSPRDLEHFLKHFDLPAQTIRNVNGSGKSFLGHTEANLDVQYIMVTGQKVPTDFWIENGMQFDLVKWVDAIAASPDAALVWSVSYGEDLTTVTSEYAQRLDTEMQKLGAVGVSIMFASGDSGVYSRTCSSGCATFRPDFPASLPSVIGIGATQLGKDGKETEAASFSGGGFSAAKYFQRNQSCPWQNDAVSTYFQRASSTLPPAKMYNAEGCGYPDMSALGVGFEVCLDLLYLQVSGTSASCPTVAGVIALLNDKRLLNGKTPFGFLGPWLYKNGAAFHDIVEGKNNGGSGDGFTAAPGWDPLTGFGTPNYYRMKIAALA
eukprot:m.485131 g.485131  ORF g.485131 m.485131 type:complete len:560 (-) comp23662_c0_seq1:50-1729(-)